MLRSRALRIVLRGPVSDNLESFYRWWRLYRRLRLVLRSAKRSSVFFVT
jgi:hypothetical protein